MFNISKHCYWYPVFFAETNSFRLSNLKHKLWYKLYFRCQSIPQCTVFIHGRRLASKNMAFRIRYNYYLCRIWHDSDTLYLLNYLELSTVFNVLLSIIRVGNMLWLLHQHINILLSIIRVGNMLWLLHQHINILRYTLQVLVGKRKHL